MPPIPRWVRLTPVLLAAWALSPWALAAEPGCKPPSNPAPAALVAPVQAKDFELGCGGKALCLLEDSLQIKKISKTATLNKVTLCFTDGSGKPPEVSRELNTGEDLGTPLQLPLSGLLTSDLIKAGRTSNFWRQQGQPAILNNKVTVTVILDVKDTPSAPPAAASAASGAAHSSKPEPVPAKLWQNITVDIASLWKSGLIKPAISQATCPCHACKLGDVLTLTVPALPAWLDATGTERSTIKLALNGTLVPALTQDLTVADPAAVRFTLARGLSPDKGPDPWVTLLNTLNRPASTVNVVLGNEQGQRLSAAKPDAVTLELAGKEQGYLAACVVMALLVIVRCVPALSRLIRDAPPLRDLAAQKPSTMAFSLGKSQMMFWTVLVFVSWAYLLCVTGNPWNFNETALILMGISSATAVGAVASSPYSAEVQAWVDKVNAINQQIDALPPADPARPTLEASKAPYLASIKQKVASQGGYFAWLADVTRNVGEEPGLHRAQSLLFTLGFGIAFGWQVMDTLAMPVFPGAALALMGISGGAYLGFKFAGAK